MLTDGVPTKGCTELLAERERARRLGVSIHTVFIGDSDYPGVLSTLATETGGARFQALPHARNKGVVRIIDFGRDSRAATRAAEQRAEDSKHALQQRKLVMSALHGTGDAITLPR